MLSADMKIYSFTISHSLQWIMYAQVEIILKRNLPLVMRNYNEAPSFIAFSTSQLHFAVHHVFTYGLPSATR